MATTPHRETPEWSRGLLPSKTSVPAVGRDIVGCRPADAKLSGLTDHRLVTVVAPAGYGKTTAVAAWVNKARTCAEGEAPVVAWYAAASEDAAPVAFVRYLAAALVRADERLAHYLCDLRFPVDSAGLTQVEDALLLALGELDCPIVLVVEDFHAVMGEQAVTDSVARLVRNLPPNAHLVLTSRYPVTIPLAKLRVAGALAEIGEDDLALDESGVRALFDGSGLPCSPQDAARVLELTRGWPAGCRLVALLCGPQTPLDQVLVRASDSLGDYLFEEVLLDLPPEQRRFLAQTAVVDAFCPSLAAAITGAGVGEVSAIVDGLPLGGLFVERIPGEDGAPWYRYHRLFADLLRGRALGLDAAELERCRLAARGWYEARGYYDSAVELAVQSGDWAFVRRLIQERWKSLYMNDAHHVLVQWASRIPREELLVSPFASAVLAMPYALCGDEAFANELIMHAVHSLKDNQDFLFAFCMVQKAFLASFKADEVSMAHFAERALAFLPADEHYLRGMMLQVQASSYRLSNPLRTRELLVQAVDAQDWFGFKNLACSALGNLAIVCADLGLDAEAARYADRAFALYDPADYPLKPMLNLAYLTRMELAFEALDYAQVGVLYQAFAAYPGEAGVGAVAAHALALHAKALYLLGDSSAGDFLARAIALDEEGASRAHAPVALVRSCGAVAALGAGSSQLVPGRRLLRAAGMPAGSAVACETLVELANEMLSQVDAIAPGDPGRWLVAVRACAVAALVCEECAHTQAADRYIQAAVRMALAQGLRGAIAQDAALLEVPLRRLVQGSQDARTVAFVRGLLGYADGEQPAVKLTDRELDVVRLVASGLSVGEAADQLVVTRETAKKHLANVYQKLGVHSKMQAVALLREQGVL